ncbi:butyrophilin subfamily 2 member A1-like, partial [Cinclus cinclus]|uniref:butyrophilin subfamily 2 member A1-like n=1 Tax=Cinclus cinclus TaxID=127875 RepID=UPI002E0D8236
FSHFSPFFPFTCPLPFSFFPFSFFFLFPFPCFSPFYPFSHPIPTFSLPISHPFPGFSLSPPSPSQGIPDPNSQFPDRWNFSFPAGSGTGSGLGMGLGTGLGIPTPLLLLVLSTLHPIIGTIPEPLLVLEGSERAGIRLRCLSEQPFPEIRLLWSGADGLNLTGIPAPTADGNAGSSLLLRPGFGNAASCRALDPNLGTAAESSVVIADVFFPAPSPCLAPFLLLLLLALSLALAAAFRLRRNRRALAQDRKSQQRIQEEIEELRMELESREMAATIELLQAQLDFRHAQSYAVSLTLERHCRAPAVAREGFSRGKHYWEVELGQEPAWELGVLDQQTRDSLQDSPPSMPQDRPAVLRYSQGEFRLPGGKLLRNSGRCRVLGVLLDQERRLLSFFDAEEKRRLGSVALETPGNLFPFFSPARAGNSPGIRRCRDQSPLETEFMSGQGIAADSVSHVSLRPPMNS